MTSDELRVIAAAQRQHLFLFLIKVFEALHPGQAVLRMAWYLEAMCHALENASLGDVQRLVVTVPPRHLKSITCSVALVAWLLGRDPTLKIMVVTYSQDLSAAHAEHCRTVMKSDWYRRLFPRTRISDRGDRKLELVTTLGGMRKAVSVGGTVTGFGADLIIIDDCMKADEAQSQVKRDELRSLYSNTLLTRLNDKQAGRVISIQQRLHEEDLPALLLESGFVHLNLPAIAEKEERIAIGKNRFHRRKVGDVLDEVREPREVLYRIRRDLGPAVFSAQYQQQPTSPEGNLLRVEWFQRYHDDLPRERFEKVVQSWDTGMSADPGADFSVCTTWGFYRQRWRLLDVFRQRLDFPDLIRAIRRLHNQWRADRVLIEKAGSGISAIQDLRLNTRIPVVGVDVTQSKEERFTATFGEVEGGYILLPAQAPWLHVFLSELRGFPNGRCDDQVDSFSQFVNHQKHNWKWAYTQFEEDGRPITAVRLRHRPPLDLIPLEPAE